MSKWTQTEVNSRAPGQVSFGLDTDQSVSVDPWMLDSSGVMHLAAPGSTAYDTTVQRSAPGTIQVGGVPVGLGRTVAGAGATVTGTTAETVLAAGYTVGALAPGQVYRFVAQGTLTTTVDTQTLTLHLRYGGVGGVDLLNWGSQNPNSSAVVTGGRWRVECDVVATSATALSTSGWNGLNFFFSAMNGSEAAVSGAAQFTLTVQPSAAAVSMTCTSFYNERVA